jgi:molybdate/tungstate transport system substrate-binding protein
VQETTPSSSTSSGGTPLVLYVADAYSLEASSILSGFSNKTGLATAPPKAGGSLLLAQEIAQGSPVDVFISVSRPAVQLQYLQGQSAGWAVAFAGDEMSLAYANSSLTNNAAQGVISAFRVAGASNASTDWRTFFQTLTSGSVKIGIADPNADPAGYRGWIVLQAAGGAYASNSSLFVRSAITNSANVSGSSAANLIAPLEAGQLQFVFIYRSAATAHGLGYLKLPGAVSLGEVSRTAFYSRFSYQLKTGVQKGGPIVLYVTIPKQSSNLANSLMFVSFVVKDSQPILQAYHLAVFSPASLYNSTAVPPGISKLVSAGFLAKAGPL